MTRSQDEQAFLRFSEEETNLYDEVCLEAVIE